MLGGGDFSCTGLQGKSSRSPSCAIPHTILFDGKRLDQMSACLCIDCVGDSLAISKGQKVGIGGTKLRCRSLWTSTWCSMLQICCGVGTERCISWHSVQWTHGVSAKILAGRGADGEITLSSPPKKASCLGWVSVLEGRNVPAGTACPYAFGYYSHIDCLLTEEQGIGWS